MAISIEMLKDMEKQSWADLCDSCEDSWVHHKGMAFLKDDDNLSFVLREDGRPLAICPVYIENKEMDGVKFRVGSFFGLSLPGPVMMDNNVGEKHAKKIRSMAFEQVCNVAKHSCIDKIIFNITSEQLFADNMLPRFNELARYDYLDVSLKMLAIDLRKSMEDLWKDLSKGHRSLLKKAIGTGNCEFINAGNRNAGFEEFSGSILPVTKVGDKQLKYLFDLFNEKALEICNYKRDGLLCGSAIFLKYKNTVQYFAAERMTEDDSPVHHLIIWECINKYKREGYDFFDLGVFSYSSQLNYLTTDKTHAIGVFKRGFGGEVHPFYLGEKYFSRDCFEKEYLSRISRYKETI